MFRVANTFAASCVHNNVLDCFDAFSASLETVFLREYTRMDRPQNRTSNVSRAPIRIGDSFIELSSMAENKYGIWIKKNIQTKKVSVVITWLRLICIGY